MTRRLTCTRITFSEYGRYGYDTENKLLKGGNLKKKHKIGKFIGKFSLIFADIEEIMFGKSQPAFK